MATTIAGAGRALVVPALLLFLLAPAAGQVSMPPAKASEASDREQITAILTSWEKAWNSHDMRAFANLFHEDGVWVLWTGAVWKGRALIEEGHAAVHKTVFRDSVQRERLEELTGADLRGPGRGGRQVLQHADGGRARPRQGHPEPKGAGRDQARGQVEDRLGAEHAARRHHARLNFRARVMPDVRRHERN
jgi:hypothetical protein